MLFAVVQGFAQRRFRCGGNEICPHQKRVLQRACLSAFLAHGEVDISSNFAENAIRPFAVGRKNWLFSDTTKDAESSAVVYTLVQTAKANGVDPYAYLLQILTELPYLDRNLSQDNLDMFLPWQPAVQTACTSSVSSKPSGDL